MKINPLLQRLASADRSWRQSRAGEKFLRTIPLFLLLLVLAAAADMVFHLGDWVRFSVVLALLVGAALIAAWLGYRAWIQTGPLLPVARLLEDRDESLGSRLVNVLQLQEKADETTGPQLTRTLAQRAVDEVSGDLGERDFRPLTKSPTMRRSAWIALAPVLLLAGLAAGFHDIAGTEWKRFLDPFGDHPPFAFTELEILTPGEEGARIVYGRPAQVEVRYSGHRPKEVFLTATPLGDPEGEATIPLFPNGEKSFVQQIDRVESDLHIRAHNRSKRARSQNREIEVILNPELENAKAVVTPPAYTGQRSKEFPLAIGGEKTPTVTALVGSEIAFHLSSNRPLSDGAAAVRTSAAEEEEVTLAAGQEEDQRHTATAVVEARESGRIRFDLRDESGLSSKQELAASLVVTHDLPPTVEITEPASDGFIVDTFQATIRFAADDDYGLRRMRIHTGINGAFGDPRKVDGPSDPPKQSMRETLEITPAEIGAKAGDVLTFFADTTDIRPDPQLARSRTLTLEVITEHQYNDYLRLRTDIRDLENKYAGLHDDLRELADEQRELAEAAREAARKGADQEQRDALAAKQSELNEKLRKLAGEMEITTRSFPLYDLENQLQEILDREAETIRNSVAENESELARFLAQGPSPGALEQFGDDGEAQADRLDPMRAQAEQEIADAMEDAALMQDLLQALGAYQQLYATQEELASQTAAMEGRSELAQEDRLALQEMAATERAISEGLDQIVEALHQGAEKAVEIYPEMADQAWAFADQIEAANLSQLADRSSRTMLGGDGTRSHQQAEHLRGEMEKLMGDCQACSGAGQGEFARRMQMMRNMTIGDTFSQMARSRRFGFGSPGTGIGGIGTGLAGFQGMGGAQFNQSPALLGGESNLGQSSKGRQGPRDSGEGRGTETPEVVEAEEGDAEGDGSEQQSRPSTSIAGDLFTDEYRDLVDAYFRKLTKTPKE